MPHVLGQFFDTPSNKQRVNVFFAFTHLQNLKCVRPLGLVTLNLLDESMHSCSGSTDGVTVGTDLGLGLIVTDGIGDGMSLCVTLGSTLGIGVEGALLGLMLGRSVALGADESTSLGELLVAILGRVETVTLGADDSTLLGELLVAILGRVDGVNDGKLDGCPLEFTVGVLLGAGLGGSSTNISSTSIR